ncbi:type II toxin-antitoxin system VapC family toxin (plasmid) [Ensifer adhaerens]|uniref:type II toxin-antitoxin system VapC family toxin n=1 Tax=Ensifer adhaerens TaxID=106592 RepID=UPI001CBD050D|nr:type II toxin-antitoxin system VapC family toxin [Ensifer adhaerens]MBZ7927063.1 type II toxin-antitoxin system VapC family toxin [Ensifer adhaerens]UAX98111.1 type II toxin-antitoxin system VapC family toxin [Ensifer adhaerens]UAY05492.1 type II toxin-antitoxin system VapC family toxin [Ensifer adhaerens]UAY12870.1 type II toxin-antitoxin system VapC family toxin [Ensifer adhaerens]
MVIYTSVLAAIAFNEPEAATFHERIADDPVRLISAASVLEAAMVIETRLGEAAGADLDLWLYKAEVEIVPVTAEHADRARRAWRRYGEGRHPVSLNYGDCFSYALAALSGEPLLNKGSDFSQTDIDAA